MIKKKKKIENGFEINISLQQHVNSSLGACLTWLVSYLILLLKSGLNTVITSLAPSYYFFLSQQAIHKEIVVKMHHLLSIHKNSLFYSLLAKIPQEISIIPLYINPHMLSNEFQ